MAAVLSLESCTPGEGWKCGAAGDQRVQSRAVSSAPRHHLSVLFRASRTWLGQWGPTTCCWFDRGDNGPPSVSNRIWASGDEGSSNRDGSSRQPPQGLPRHEPALRMCLSGWSSQSRHSSLHLLGAHPPVDAVTAGRQGRDLRQTQTRLAPSSVVGTPAGQTIRLGNRPAACVPVLRLVDFFVDAEIRQRRGQDSDNCPGLT